MRARSASMSKNSRRRSCEPSSAIVATKRPSGVRWTAIRSPSEARAARRRSSASRTIWYSAACTFSPSCSGGRDVDGDLDLPLHAHFFRERLHGRREPLVAEHDGLEVERQVAQRPDRLAVTFERVGQHLLRGFELAFLDRVADGIEHQRDAGEVLHRPVVEEQRDPAPLVLLGGDQSLGEPSALGCPPGRARRDPSR